MDEQLPHGTVVEDAEGVWRVTLPDQPSAVVEMFADGVHAAMGWAAAHQTAICLEVSRPERDTAWMMVYPDGHYEIVPPQTTTPPEPVAPESAAPTVEVPDQPSVIVEGKARPLPGPTMAAVPAPAITATPAAGQRSVSPAVPVVTPPMMPVATMPAGSAGSAGGLSLTDELLGRGPVPAGPPAVMPAAPPGWQFDLGSSGVVRPVTTSVLSTAWQRTLVILVANPKGGAGKSPTSILLGNAFGRQRASDVLALDLNPTGTLAEMCGMTAPALPDFVAAAQQGQMDWPAVTARLGFDPAARMWVLDSGFRGPHGTQVDQREITADGFIAALETLSVGMRVIVLDAGNITSPDIRQDEVFMAAARRADQIVVPVDWGMKSLSLAGEMLNQLYTAGLAKLVNEAIIVGTFARKDRPASRQVAMAKHQFAQLGNTIVDIPSDAHIAEKSAIAWEKLGAKTRQAATALATMVATRYVGSAPR